MDLGEPEEIIEVEVPTFPEEVPVPEPVREPAPA